MGRYTAAVEAIREVCQTVRGKPCLLVNESGVATGARRAKKEQTRRSDHRELYEELSRYYPRDKGLWTQTKLLSRGKDECIQCTGGVPLTHFPTSPT
jgi:hypothetical protein